jgi:hypothetical protein
MLQGQLLGPIVTSYVISFARKRIFNCPVILGSEPTKFPTKRGPLVGNIITRVVAGVVVVGRGQSRDKWSHLLFRRSRYSDELRTGRPGFDSRECKIFLFSTACRLILVSTQPPFQWAPGGKRQCREDDHSLQSSAEFKKGGGAFKYRNNFTFTSIIKVLLWLCWLDVIRAFVIKLGRWTINFLVSIILTFWLGVLWSVVKEGSVLSGTCVHAKHPAKNAASFARLQRFMTLIIYRRWSMVPEEDFCLGGRIVWRFRSVGFQKDICCLLLPVSMMYMIVTHPHIRN